MNKGKAFEKDFQEAAKNDELFVILLYLGSMKKLQGFNLRTPVIFWYMNFPIYLLLSAKALVINL